MRTPLATYKQWNEQVSQYFFRESNEGSPIYLEPSEELFGFLGTRLPVETGSLVRQRFVEVVRGVLKLDELGKSVFEDLNRELEMWKYQVFQSMGTDRTERIFPPPVSMFLVVCVMAAQRMADASADGKEISPNNYYVHLQELLGLQGWSKESLREDFRVTEMYWDAISWWMEDCDGRFGLPTARSASLRYVGLPISQAMVREADRQGMHRAFADQGLSPGESLAPAEMGEVLHQWITSVHGGASKSLQTKWKQNEARERITEVAIAELLAWDGDDSKAGPRKGAAALSAPKATVPLVLRRLGRTSDGERGELGLAVHTGMLSAQWSLKHADGVLPLDPRRLSASESFIALGDIGVRPEQLLESEVMLESSDGRTMVRQPRRIVLLVEDANAGAHIEVRRAVSGARHRILVSPRTPENVQERLRDLLRVTGFAGDRDLIVDGVPEDWLVVDGYIPVRAGADLDLPQELQVLMAPASSGMVLIDGLRFPGRLQRWHADVPPRVVVTADSCDEALHVVLLDSERTVVSTFALRGAGIVDLPADLGSGDFYLELRDVAKRNTRVLQAQMLRLATGERRSSEGLRRLADLGHDETALAATRTVEQGYLVIGAIAAETEPGQEPSAVLPPEIRWAARYKRHDKPAKGVMLRAAGTVSCLITGSHRWHLPSPRYKEKPGRWQMAVCTQCGAMKRQPTRHWDALKRSEREQILAARGRVVAADDSSEGRIVGETDLLEAAERPLSPELFADSVAYLGAGDLSSFEALAVQFPDLVDDVRDLVRDDSALGRIEAGRDDRFRRITWEACPPALVELADGSFGVTGTWPAAQWRNLTRELAELGEELLLPEGRNSLPRADALVMRSIVYGQADGVQTGSVSAFPDVEFAGRAFERICASLPPLSAVLAELPRVDVRGLTGEFQVFSVADVSWASVSGIEAEGLFRRTDGYSRQYWVRTAVDVEAGSAAPIDVETGKHLAGLLAGRPIIGYDEPTRALTVPLGARLPELYERAAVLCSGRAPTTDKSEFCHRYLDVPPTIAARIHARMSS